MEPVGAARPGSRSGTRAARDAAPHSCSRRLAAAAPGPMRDGTGSGSWSCRRRYTRAAGWPVLRAAARMGRDAAPPETAGLVLTPDRQPKLGAERIGLLDQLFLAIASGSLTRTTPCLRLRIT